MKIDFDSPATHAVRVPQHQDVPRRRSQLAHDAHRVRNVEVRDPQRAQDEAGAVLEVPILSDDLDTSHHGYRSESGVVAVDWIPHPAPDLLGSPCLRRTDDSYHATIAPVIKS